MAGLLPLLQSAIFLGGNVWMHPSPKMPIKWSSDNYNLVIILSIRLQLPFTFGCTWDTNAYKVTNCAVLLGLHTHITAVLFLHADAQKCEISYMAALSTLKWHGELEEIQTNWPIGEFGDFLKIMTYTKQLTWKSWNALILGPAILQEQMDSTFFLLVKVACDSQALPCAIWPKEGPLAWIFLLGISVLWYRQPLVVIISWQYPQPKNQLAFQGRMLTENVAMNIDVDFFKARVSRALEAEMARFGRFGLRWTIGWGTPEQVECSLLHLGVLFSWKFRLTFSLIWGWPKEDGCVEPCKSLSRIDLHTCYSPKSCSRIFEKLCPYVIWPVTRRDAVGNQSNRGGWHPNHHVHITIMYQWWIW